MTKPTSYTKGAMGDGKSAQSSKSDFKAATAGQSQQATAKAAESKPEPKQVYNRKGPGETVTKAAAQQRQDKLHAEKSADLKALKENANNVTKRQNSKAHDKIKSKDDIQK